MAEASFPKQTQRANLLEKTVPRQLEMPEVERSANRRMIANQCRDLMHRHVLSSYLPSAALPNSKLKANLLKRRFYPERISTPFRTCYNVCHAHGRTGNCNVAHARGGVAASRPSFPFAVRLGRARRASRISCIALKGACVMSAPPVSSASVSGPLFSIATPLLTNSTWPDL